MIYIAIKKIPHEAEKKPCSFRILQYEKNKAFFDRILSRKHPASRRNALEAYSLLDSLLLQFTDLKTAALARSEHGKPFIVGNNVTFNISHTEGAVACAIDTCGGDVGIDIEQIGRDGGDIITRFFDDAANLRYKAASDKPRTFAEIWTEKEAYSKFLGIGLSDYKTDYPRPHLFTKTEENGYVITACTEPDANIRICQNAEDAQIQ